MPAAARKKRPAASAATSSNHVSNSSTQSAAPTTNTDDDSSDDPDVPSSGVVVGSKRKKTSKGKQNKRRTRRSPSPEVPDLSDHELVDDRPYDLGNYAVNPRPVSPNRLSPRDFVFQLTAGDKTLANVNLQYLLDHNSGLSALPPTNQQTPTSIFSNGQVNEDDTLVNGDNKILTAKTNWKDLPYELRLHIYRLLFLGPACVDFSTRKNLSRSSHFLRTSKEIHSEGLDILYGENSFHFDRIFHHRGSFWQEKWTEIAYKDARRFFDTIGSTNISHIKYLSFNFADGTPGNNPGVALPYRKYINDANLMHIFKMVADNTTLHKLSVCFAGRGFLKNDDRHFWQHFTRIRCRHLEVFTWFRGQENKAQFPVRQQLRDKMQVKFDKDHESDRVEKKKSKVPMVYEVGLPGSVWVSILD